MWTPGYWIVSLNTMNPRIVTGPGQFRTRSGEVVTVEEVDNLQAYGRYQDGIKERWTLSGRVLPVYESPNDIVGAA